MKRFSLLTRHFIGATLAPDLLTELGSDYLRRVIFGVLAILLVLGSFLPRVFFHKYTVLGTVVGRSAYLQALQADSLFMIAVPMMLVGLVAVIAAPLMFPDETDYLVLTPLPISRALLFGAKLAAVLVVIGAAIVAVNAVASFWFPIAVGSTKAGHPTFTRFVAHAVASVSGSLFMCLAVMALQGLTVTMVPHRWQRRVSVLIQTAICVGLLMSVPLIARMSGMAVNQGTVVESPLVWMPPAWFLGVERWLLDGALAGSYVTSARIAMWALFVVAMTSVASYGLLFRSAERLGGISGADRRTLTPPGRLAEWSSSRLSPQTFAVLDFVRIGLARSRLHQFVFLLAVGAGIGALIGQLATALDADRTLGWPRSVEKAVIAAPLIIGLAVALGLRAAYRWPLDRGAAWIFQMTEERSSRARVLNGAALPLVASTWTLPMTLAAAVQQPVLGPAWWSVAIPTSILMVAVAELLLIDWRRIPYACSYLPGRYPLAYHLGVLCGHYFIVVIIGGRLIHWGMGSPLRTLIVSGLLLTVWAVIRRERRQSWGRLSLEFEDDDPAIAAALKLGG